VRDEDVIMIIRGRIERRDLLYPRALAGKCTPQRARARMIVVVLYFVRFSG